MRAPFRKYGIFFLAGLILIVLLSAFMKKNAPTPYAPTPYILNYPAYFGNRINTTDENPLTREGVELGRQLFYEKKLSANNTISCGSCHRQQLAFTDGRRFSPGFDGTPTKRNSMSLANLLWVRHFFWDGRAGSLEEQALTPLTDPHEMGQSLDSTARKLEMDVPPGQNATYPQLFTAAFGPDPRNPNTSPITPTRIVRALTQFERTLISSNSPYDKYLRGGYKPTPAEQKGIALFYTSPDPVRGIRGAGCGNCHGGPKVFNETYHNNGLDSVPKDPGREGVTGMSYDRGRFRVVTLRNIALTAPYMHDGRFSTLSDVVDHYSEHIQPGLTLSPSLRNVSNELNRPTGLRLTEDEKTSLLAFLAMLTDSAFISDPRFADPHISDPRVSDRRISDRRISDPRITKPRNAGPAAKSLHS
jgi:cytochrome c peroxidase